MSRSAAATDATLQKAWWHIQRS